MPAGDRSEALLREAAHRLADTVALYDVLTRERLAALSGEWLSTGLGHAGRGPALVGRPMNSTAPTMFS